MQCALVGEALDQRGAAQPHRLGDIGKREALGPEPQHDGMGGIEDLIVGNEFGAWHGPLITAAAVIRK